MIQQFQSLANLESFGERPEGDLQAKLKAVNAKFEMNQDNPDGLVFNTKIKLIQELTVRQHGVSEKSEAKR